MSVAAIKAIAKSTAKIAGEMSMHIEKGKASRRMIEEWIMSFEMSAVRLRQLISNRSKDDAGTDNNDAAPGDERSPETGN